MKVKNMEIEDLGELIDTHINAVTEVLIQIVRDAAETILHKHGLIPKPEWKPGDWAWIDCDNYEDDNDDTSYHGICQIKGTNSDKPYEGWFDFIMLDGRRDCRAKIFFRPLTDEHWTSEIGGVKVTASETVNGKALLAQQGTNWQMLDNRLTLDQRDRITRDISRKFDIPIKPYGVK